MSIHKSDKSKRQHTEPKKLLELAQQGNPNAIATLINQSLQPQGIAVTTKLTRNCLYIFVELQQVPPPKTIVTLIRNRLASLGIESIKTAKVYGRQLGESLTTWTHEFELKEQTDSTLLSSETSPSHVRNRAPSPEVSPSRERNKNITTPKASQSSLKSQEQMGVHPRRKGERIFLVTGTFLLTSMFWLVVEKKQFFSVINPQLVPSFIRSRLQPKTTIAGAAWLTKQSGDSDIIRGLEIVLCQRNIKPELISLRDTKWQENFNKFKNKSGYVNLNIQAMNQKVASHKDCLQIIKTDVEGKYKIPDVTVGSYFLYAPLETSFFKGYWLVPVQVETGKPLHIDLDNSNMAEVYNKE